MEKDFQKPWGNLENQVPLTFKQLDIFEIHADNR